jgi:hypothetical protein
MTARSECVADCRKHYEGYFLGQCYEICIDNTPGPETMTEEEKLEKMAPWARAFYKVVPQAFIVKDFE